MTLINVYGFYNRSNIGDDQYQTTLNSLLRGSNPDGKPLEIRYCDRDHLDLDCDIFIAGGGDVLNDYFMKPLYVKWQDVPKIKRPLMLALSVGVPYLSVLDQPLYNMFDQVFLRTFVDLDQVRMALLKKAPFTERVSYCPDLSVLLDVPSTSSFREDKNSLTVAVCLARPLIASPTVYDHFLNDFAEVLNILSFQYNVTFHLLNFNSDAENSDENDNLINEDLITLAESNWGEGMAEKVLVHRKDLNTYQDVLSFIKNESDCVIGMRFHSIYFSILAQKPFFPIIMTTKLKNVVVNELKWPLKYVLPTDYNGTPTGSIDIIDCLEMIMRMINFSGLWVERMKPIMSKWKAQIDKVTKPVLTDILTSPSRYKLPKYLARGYNDIVQKSEEILPVLFKPSNYVEANSTAACFLYGITGCDCREYIHGFVSKFGFEKDFTITDPTTFYREIEWVLWDKMNTLYDSLIFFPLQNYSSIELPIKPSLFNMSYIAQRSFVKYHRAGWEYVAQSLTAYDDPSSSSYLDLYIDRTFHWNGLCQENLGVIPYKNSWSGFIHHTFLKHYSGNNCVNLFKSKSFVESLKTCKYLFVLSDYLKKQVENALKCLEIPLTTKVATLYHPTEFVSEDRLFSWSAYESQESKQVINVGGWLRDMYSFYLLEVPSNFTKKALLGKGISNSWVPKLAAERYLFCELLKDSDIEDHSSQKESSICPCSRTESLPCSRSESFPCSRPLTFPCSSSICPCSKPCSCSPTCPVSDKEEYQQRVDELVKEIEPKVSSVSFIEELDDQDFDQLLSQHVVFLRLFDCSAANTVIECIVRNTPLIVNRLPALEEYLGKDYPLFYHKIEEVKDLLSMESLKSGHEYLKALDKNYLKVETFVEQLISYFQ